MFKGIITIVFTGILFLNVLSSYSQINPTPQKPSESIKPVDRPNQDQPVSVQEDPQNQLGLIYTVKRLDEARKLIEEGNYEQAEKILLDAKTWLTDATEFHYSLFQIFNKQQKNITLAKIEKAHASDFGNARDQAFYLLAKTYIGKNKLKVAASLLIQIIKSQHGTILSEQAYKTLLEIKFSDKAK